MKKLIPMLTAIWLSSAVAAAPDVIFRHSLEYHETFKSILHSQVSSDMRSVYLVDMEYMPSTRTNPSSFYRVRYNKMGIFNKSVSTIFDGLENEKSIKAMATAISSDGKRVAIGNHDHGTALDVIELRSNGQDQSESKLHPLPSVEMGSDFSYAADTQDLLILNSGVTAGGEGMFINAAGAVQRKLTLPRRNFWHGALSNPTISADGRYSAFEQGDEHIYLYENSSGKVLDIIDGTFKRPTNRRLLKFAGNQWLVHVEMYKVEIYQVINEKLKLINTLTPQMLKQPGRYFYQATLSDDGKTLAVATSNKHITLVDLGRGNAIVNDWPLSMEHYVTAIQDLQLSFANQNSALMIQSHRSVEVLSLED